MKQHTAPFALRHRTNISGFANKARTYAERLAGAPTVLPSKRDGWIH